MCWRFEGRSGARAMPRDKQYTEWASEADKTDREDRDRLRDLDDVKDLFEDAEVRQRVAELIARSAHRAKKLDQ
jgi:hypothetical protein